MKDEAGQKNSNPSAADVRDTRLGFLSPASEFTRAATPLEMNSYEGCLVPVWDCIAVSPCSYLSMEREKFHGFAIATRFFFLFSLLHSCNSIVSCFPPSPSSCVGGDVMRILYRRQESSVCDHFSFRRSTWTGRQLLPGLRLQLVDRRTHSLLSPVQFTDP
jgi:hypothetical protein